MELNQIRYFILTAQLQNMSQAAHALGIAQPTLSKSISNLENELGVQLFDRVGKKLILNERGRRFLEGTALSLEELENAAAAVQDQAMEATLNMGLFYVSDAFLACLDAFTQQYPQTVLNVYQLHGNPDEIDTNNYDVLLYTGDTMFRKYKGTLAYSEAFSLAVHKSNPLSGKESVSVAELAGQKLVFFKYGKRSYDVPYRLCSSLVSAQQGHLFTNSYEIQRQMISSGYCIGFVPVGQVQSYKNDSNIALVSILDEGFAQDIYIGFKREKHLNENGKRFLSFATDYFGLGEA